MYINYTIRNVNDFKGCILTVAFYKQLKFLNKLNVKLFFYNIEENLNLLKL